MFVKYPSAIYKVEIHFLNYSVHNLITKEPYAQDTLTTVPLFTPLAVSMSIHNLRHVQLSHTFRTYLITLR